MIWLLDALTRLDYSGGQNYANGRILTMIMEINVTIKDADGNIVVKPITVETGVPDFDDFTGPDKFREEFNVYEKAVLRARNEAAEKATEEYLAELSKKKRQTM